MVAGNDFYLLHEGSGKRNISKSYGVYTVSYSRLKDFQLCTISAALQKLLVHTIHDENLNQVGKNLNVKKPNVKIKVKTLLTFGRDSVFKVQLDFKIFFCNLHLALSQPKFQPIIAT
jgi:hypothetical protein